MDVFVNGKATFIAATCDLSTDSLRIMVRRQVELWSDGLSVAAMLAKHKLLHGSEDSRAELEEDAVSGALEDDPLNEVEDDIEAVSNSLSTKDYGGGKWGRYLRAPELYFQIMGEFGSKFSRLGDIATIKYGILSGCDGFFMPHDVSKKLLEDCPNELTWRSLPLMRRCDRDQVERGNVVLVQCSDGTIHPLESKFVIPELHSLMEG